MHHFRQRSKPAATKAKRRKKRRKINFYAVATGTGIGIYKCWQDMKHLVVGRNEHLLHEGFETLEEAQKYVWEHRNHHVGAKQRDKAKAERHRERRRKEEAERVMAPARAVQAPSRPTATDITTSGNNRPHGV